MSSTRLSVPLISQSGKLSAISIGPQNTVVVPSDPESDRFTWGDGSDVTDMWTPGVAGDPILVGNVIGQPVGNLFLLSPLAGGMPWYVNQGPPPTAMRVPVEASTTPIPLGWAINNQDGPMGPFPATGNPVSLEYAGFLRIEDGMIAEMWVVWDNLGMLVGLGHLEPPGPQGGG